MSKQASPGLIGSFVVGAVVLLVVATLLFGGSELLETKVRFVTYFSESVKGLRVGSNVTLRGVRLGYVQNIQLIGDADSLDTAVQVTMEVLPNSFLLAREGKILDIDEYPELTHQTLIDAGLRAQLNVESFVTGQLLVELDFLPAREAVFVSSDPDYPEIPSVRSNTQEVVDKVQRFIADIQENVDIKQLLGKVESILDGADELANSSELREMLIGVNRLANNASLQELPESLQDAATSLRVAMVDARRLVNNADSQIQPLIDELRPAIESLAATLEAGEEALDQASAQITGDTRLAYELNNTLVELQGAARSLRLFLDYIERNPEAIVRGKKP
jgi:paraquat-inducible protein B